MLHLPFVWIAITVSLWKNVSSNSLFSGFYSPNTKLSSEDFAASWLVTKQRFFMAETGIAESQNMAGVSFGAVRIKKSKCAECGTIMTRDFLDLFVEHLSSSTNLIPNNNKEIFNVTTNRLVKTVKQLKRAYPKMRVKEPRQNQTMAILVYSSNTFTILKTDEQMEIRQHFFEATFWSVKRYFPDVYVFVGDEKDRRIVEVMDLPYKSLEIIETPLDFRNRSVLLPRYSVLKAMNDLKEGQSNSKSPYNKYQYVFFTEGDQILHMRSAKQLYNVLDNSDGMFALVPHRMQTLYLMKKTFPESYHKFWPSNNVQHYLDHIELVTEDMHRSKGSCCDSGRHTYQMCDHTWWYKCPRWGLRNFTMFLRFGKSGFTMPPSTEHQAVCKYSSEFKVCPLPDSCTGSTQLRKPERKENGTKAVTMSDICEEMPVVKHFGSYLGDR